MYCSGQGFTGLNRAQTTWPWKSPSHWTAQIAQNALMMLWCTHNKTEWSLIWEEMTNVWNRYSPNIIWEVKTRKKSQWRYQYGRKQGRAELILLFHAFSHWLLLIAFPGACSRSTQTRKPSQIDFFKHAWKCQGIWSCSKTGSGCTSELPWWAAIWLWPDLLSRSENQIRLFGAAKWKTKPRGLCSGSYQNNVQKWIDCQNWKPGSRMMYQ